jgi:hypothetical protein
MLLESHLISELSRICNEQMQVAIAKVPKANHNNIIDVLQSLSYPLHQLIHPMLWYAQIIHVCMACTAIAT